MDKKTNKELLAKMLHEKHGLPKAQSKRIVNDMFDEIIEVVASGGKATLSGFGVFGKKVRKARKGFNVSKREFDTIKASEVPTFKPSPKFKEKLERD